MGCMRCKFGGTPACKVHKWTEILEYLRQIALESGLKEEVKWGAPVYTHQGKNIIAIGALKNFATLGFFKGVLLRDPEGILQQQGNLQSDRIVKFTQVEDVERLESTLREYIKEAVAIEESGQKVTFQKNPEPIPEELLEAFDAAPVFRNAFYQLTPGRQRGYIIHFSQPKQASTRTSRIERYKEQILAGIGLHGHYKSRK
jgi:uncharacterized protein YdeI (YjbR/CyaY-like superfamily)